MGLIHLVTRNMLPAGRESDALETHRSFAIAVDRMRSGEQLVALVDPESLPVEPDGGGVWLSARLTIGTLPRLMHPRCDRRCSGLPHDPHGFVALADLALDVTEPRRPSWWQSWTDSLQRDQRTRRTWYAGAPLLPDTPEWRRLCAGTRLTRLTATDPYWVHYDTVNQEVLYRIDDGPYAGDALIAASFGMSPLLPGLAGALIGPDHPPSYDPAAVLRLLTAGWAAVERGLPFEG